MKRRALVILLIISTLMGWHFYDVAENQRPFQAKICKKNQQLGKIVKVCDYKPELKESTLKLISDMHAAHKDPTKKVSLESFLAFIGDKLDEETIKKIKKRKNITLIPDKDKNTGRFINRGEKITTTIDVGGRSVTVTIPTVLKGRYALDKNFCELVIDDPSITGCVYWFICDSLRKITATDKKIKAAFDNQSSGVCASFVKEDNTWLGPQ